jgi:hypothetical protein
MFLKLNLFLISLIVLNYLPFAYAQDSLDVLNGEWRLLNQPGNWEVKLIFKRSGDFTVQRYLSADYTYKLDGNRLITVLNKPDSDSAMVVDTSYIKLNGDTLLVSYYKNGIKTTKSMLRDVDSLKKNKSDSTIIGRWTWRYPTKELAVETFSDDGSYQITILGTIYEGNYVVNSDTLNMIYNNKNHTNKMHTFWVKGKLLGIRDLKTNNEYLYKKTE